MIAALLGLVLFGASRGQVASSPVSQSDPVEVECFAKLTTLDFVDGIVSGAGLCDVQVEYLTVNLAAQRVPGIACNDVAGPTHNGIAGGVSCGGLIVPRGFQPSCVRGAIALAVVPKWAPDPQLITYNPPGEARSRCTPFTATPANGGMGGD